MATTEPEVQMDNVTSNRSSDLPLTSFPPSKHGFNFRAYTECQQEVLNKPPPDDGKLYCTSVFDKWLCWDYTPAGETAYGRCPHYFMPGFNKDAFAEKQCMENGQWFKNIVNITWTNYMPCTTHQEGLTVLLVYISGYVLSAILLIASIFIFCYFRQLRCTRVILHQHLFMSYIITALLWTVSYTQLMTRLDVTRSNPTWCKVIHVLTQYISISNYFWMFCEGFFLHTIIVHAFSKETKLLIITYIIGWGAPVIPTVLYAVIRATNQEMDRDCWIFAGWPLWIINGPIAASLIINFFFFLNIMRILLSKIRAFNNNEQSQYRRAVKATLIMIPLLGVNNLVMLVRPDMDRLGVFVWKIISAFLVAYQGVSVALIFCFFNGEVMTVLRRKWSQWRNAYDPHMSGRMRSTSHTMALTLDESSVTSPGSVTAAAPKNGFACTSSRTAPQNAQDPTELHTMMSANKQHQDQDVF